MEESYNTVALNEQKLYVQILLQRPRRDVQIN